MPRPARTTEEKEQEMINYAIDLAEKQLIEGTASASVITHYLKLGSTRAALEVEKLRNENALLKAKSDDIESRRESDKKYQKVIAAMWRYSGHGGSHETEELL